MTKWDDRCESNIKSSIMLRILFHGISTVTLLFFSNIYAQSDLIRQSLEEAFKKSEGCLFCHNGIEKMHKSPAVKLGCTDCHGGNAQVKTIKEGHVKPKYADKWKTSANPVDHWFPEKINSDRSTGFCEDSKREN